MIVLDSYPMQPSCCYYCHNTKTPCVDLMRDDDDNPNRIEHIYLCWECLRTAAMTVGPQVPNPHDAFEVIRRPVVTEMRTRLVELAAEVDVARSARDRAIAARDGMLASLNAEPRTEGASVGAGTLTLAVPVVEPVMVGTAKLRQASKAK